MAVWKWLHAQTNHSELYCWYTSSWLWSQEG